MKKYGQGIFATMMATGIIMIFVALLYKDWFLLVTAALLFVGGRVVEYYDTALKLQDSTPRSIKQLKIDSMYTHNGITRVGWSSTIGHGSIVIDWNKGRVDTENMDPDFSKAVLNKVFDKLYEDKTPDISTGRHHTNNSILKST